ncbi:UNVERIFIED_CONTAM: Retrovirus-related Pol polyprotein from transposon TNT 1-94 [Sesamum latifolium]|uniref:Retrovirus-related Pol polyprotein from transposon TNT 1-94 n=1 Tax=Sesamum latifolium TaxID=2727402 RepID=A0AAW2VD81_9LAMI
MKGILIQQKVFKAIDGRYTENISEEKRLENDEFAYSSIILNLSDSVIRKDIKLTGDKNIDDYTPIVLLNAIPETYSDVKAAIKYGRDNGRTKNRNSDYKYRKNGRSRSRSKSRSKFRDREERPRDEKYRERRCYNCGGKGHYIKDCRKPKRDNRNNNNRNDSEDANFVSDNNGEVYMVSDVNNVQTSMNMHEWLIDFGCTFHMSPYKEIFSNYKTDNLGFVAMANEKLYGIKGLGDVCVTFKNGYKLTLKNVRHVPDLCHNLMSCSALEEGLEGRWGKGIMKIMKGSLNVFKAERKRNLYMCYVKYDSFTASVSEHDKTSLWHKRLEHISLKGLDLLHKNGLLTEKFKSLNFCDDCVLGKHHKVHFPALTQMNDILDYVHADVWGPANVETHGGNRTEEEYNIEHTFNKVEENTEDNQQGEENREENRNVDNNPENVTVENTYSLARDRERREHRIPSRFRDFHLALNIEDSEPASFDEALKSPKSELWLKAMKEEMKSLHDNKTWVLVPKPKDASIVDCKMIVKLKHENNSLRYKARLVAKGFTQKEGIDYTEIFSPVVKYTTVRIILALTAHFNWELKQMDVKNSFSSW